MGKSRSYLSAEATETCKRLQTAGDCSATEVIECALELLEWAYTAQAKGWQVAAVLPGNQGRQVANIRVRPGPVQ